MSNPQHGFGEEALPGTRRVYSSLAIGSTEGYEAWITPLGNPGLLTNIELSFHHIRIFQWF
jgi:hypothetical protein